MQLISLFIALPLLFRVAYAALPGGSFKCLYKETHFPKAAADNEDDIEMSAGYAAMILHDPSKVHFQEEDIKHHFIDIVRQARAYRKMPHCMIPTTYWYRNSITPQTILRIPVIDGQGRNNRGAGLTCLTDALALAVGRRAGTLHNFCGKIDDQQYADYVSDIIAPLRGLTV